MPKRKQGGQLGETRKLSPGIKLVRAFEGHEYVILSVAFDLTGQMLASGSADNTVRLWNVANGRLLRTLEGHNGNVYSVAFAPQGRTLASGSGDGTVKLWDADSGEMVRTFGNSLGEVHSVAFDQVGRTLAGSSDKVRLWEVGSGKLLHTLEGHQSDVLSIVFDQAGRTMAGGTFDGKVKLWEVASGGELLHTLEGHRDLVRSVAFDPGSIMLASGGDDRTVKLWDAASGKLLHSLEGHTQLVDAIAFSMDGRLLTSKSIDGTLRIWSCETWETVAVIPEMRHPNWSFTGIAFHPTLPLLATVGSRQDAPEHERSMLIHLWKFDLDVLLSKAQGARITARVSDELVSKAVHHTTAKIVLVGDAGVGKTGLGWRLAHNEYKEHSSTHGQQFWVVNELGTRRKDGTECEAILWDLAGQPDYRLTHALFLDDSDLALILFDPTDSRDPLHGVEFWLKQLKAGNKQNGSQMILVGARADRGEARLTQMELDEFCRQRGISGGYLATSAKEDIGLDELLRRMKAQIPWEQKPATVTTLTFKRIKDYVLKLKEIRRSRRKVIVSPRDLRKQLEQTHRHRRFNNAEMMTAVGHLANYGYVRVLRTSKGEECILLAPELLNNLAASFVLEARRNPKGLGSLEEKRLLAGEYRFRELEKLTAEERDVLLDSAALLFLEHNVCFRETDPLSNQSYLVFPELINLKKPVLKDEIPIEDGAGYAVSGAVENVYASLVVLLGYTQTFARADQWRSQARYEMGDGLICGFRQDGERDGELDLVLYFGKNIGQPVRTLFQCLFESFLARRNLSVFRYEPAFCANGHPINRAVVRERLRSEKGFAFCEECGAKVTLPKAGEPIQLTRAEKREVEEQQWFATQRSRFEQAVFQVMSYVENQNVARPECFISYAWGNREQERWVERNLSTDLQKAGIYVVLDRWENSRVGASVPRFIERIEKCDLVIMVGTPLYRKKYDNKDTSTGYVVAAEVDLISNRLLATETEKETVLPLLLAGERDTSLPPLLHSRVFADFRNEREYFITAFDLILNIYKIAHHDPAVADLRETLREREMR